MSCSTLNSQTVGLNVATANLPEGFCPASMQELLQAFGARLIITPNQSFNGFAIGSVAPTSNVGPWFKDCTEFFVFDDATASYIPLPVRGTFATQQYFTTSGNFIVPDFIYRLKVSVWGAGGGGSGQFGAGTSGGGGGAGGYGQKVFSVTPGQNIAYTVGMGGVAGVSVGGAGAAGGNTVFLTMTANGGSGNPAVVHTAGAGGAVTGATISSTGGFGQAGIGSYAGMGGSSPNGGQGGTATYGGVPANSFTGITPGGGGAGGWDSTQGQQLDGGAGAGGAVLIEY